MDPSIVENVQRRLDRMISLASDEFEGKAAPEVSYHLHAQGCYALTHDGELITTESHAMLPELTRVEQEKPV